MFDRIRALIHRLHEMQEVNALSDRDLDDLGMTRDQVLDFLRADRAGGNVELGEIGTDCGMRPFDLVVKRLADVVEQPADFRRANVHP